MLRETHAMAANLHRAFFDIPPGSPDGTRPFIENLRVLVLAYQRGSWLAKIVVWAVLGMATIGGAILQINGWMPWSGK